jgi:hypothetical protein
MLVRRVRIERKQLAIVGTASAASRQERFLSRKVDLTLHERLEVDVE